MAGMTTKAGMTTLGAVGAMMVAGPDPMYAGLNHAMGDGAAASDDALAKGTSRPKIKFSCGGEEEGEEEGLFASRARSTGGAQDGHRPVREGGLKASDLSKVQVTKASGPSGPASVPTMPKGGVALGR